uniref:PKD/REJ-like domain-containing protein n=1 Tax=Aceria tosichella TaxID=561515 RepID=A0A6G1SAA5_9ACAR
MNFLTTPINLILTCVILAIGQCSGQSNQTDNAGGELFAIPLVASDTLTAVNIEVWIEASLIKRQSGTNYVPANTPIQIQAKSSSSLNSSAIIYAWSTKDGPIKAEPNANSVVYQFTKSDEDNFIQLRVRNPATNSSGEARLNVTVKSRVIVGDPLGKTFLEKGELLDITLVYSGSPPFTYCYKFCSIYDILPCSVCLSYVETSNTSIHIVHYLHYVGNYTLMFKIDNIMNHEERQYAIKINDTVSPRSNLPIAPIVSSILAVCIIITGVGLHMRFKDTSYTTETANFDFFHDDDDEEWEQELSLIQRIRYLFCGSEQDEESETSYLLSKGTTSYCNGQRQKQEHEQEQQEPGADQ